MRQIGYIFQLFWDYKLNPENISKKIFYHFLVWMCDHSSKDFRKWRTIGQKLSKNCTKIRQKFAKSLTKKLTTIRQKIDKKSSKNLTKNFRNMWQKFYKHLTKIYNKLQKFEEKVIW